MKRSTPKASKQAPGGQRLPRLDDLWVPTRWVKDIFAVFLLPVTLLTAATITTLLVRLAVVHKFLVSQEFWFFATGFLMWIIVFFGLHRRFLFLYVTGHEFTHAIMVWMLGGRVTRMELATDGGAVHVSKSNFFIALGPYFFPFFTAGLLAVWLPLGTVVDLAPALRWFCLLLGLTWGFHVTFTLWMIPREQTDLLDNGLFFSISIIVLMNLLVVAIMLVAASPDIGFRDFAKEWVGHGVSITAWLERQAAQL